MFIPHTRMKRKLMNIPSQAFNGSNHDPPVPAHTFARPLRMRLAESDPLVKWRNIPTAGGADAIYRSVWDMRLLLANNCSPASHEDDPTSAAGDDWTLNS